MDRQTPKDRVFPLVYIDVNGENCLFVSVFIYALYMPKLPDGSGQTLYIRNYHGPVGVPTKHFFPNFQFKGVMGRFVKGVIAIH